MPESRGHAAVLAETSVPLLHLRHAVHPAAKLETFQKAVEASSTRLGRSYKQRSICFLLRDPLTSKVLCALFLWPLPAGGGPTGQGRWQEKHMVSSTGHRPGVPRAGVLSLSVFTQTQVSSATLSLCYK